jgi:predicted ABC-type ATPase
VLEIAKANGFEVTIMFLYLDSAEACVARVQERVRKGGHDLPAADVHRRFARSMSNFWQIYRQIADHWLLVYNASGQSKEVAMGSRDEFSVRDGSLFQSFIGAVPLRKGKHNDGKDPRPTH